MENTICLFLPSDNARTLRANLIKENAPTADAGLAARSENSNHSAGRNYTGRNRGNEGSQLEDTPSAS